MTLWAIEAQALEEIQGQETQRQEVLAKMQAQPGSLAELSGPLPKAEQTGETLAAQTPAYQRTGKVAVIFAAGVITPTRDWFLYYTSGNIALDRLTADIGAALADPEVDSIVLHLNSPGGYVSGTRDFAEWLAQAQQTKPIYSYTNGMMASAAYWIGAAATQVFACPTAEVGSVGVRLTAQDNSGYFSKLGILFKSMVNQKSPKKATSPFTKEGEADYIGLLNATAEVFINSLATYRGKTNKQVQADFGQGFLVAAEPALKAGMVDGVCSFHQLVSSLESGTLGQITANQHSMETSMSAENQTPPAGSAAGTEESSDYAQAITALTQTNAQLVAQNAAAAAALVEAKTDQESLATAQAELDEAKTQLAASQGTTTALQTELAEAKAATATAQAATTALQTKLAGYTGDTETEVTGSAGGETNPKSKALI